ncbi:HD domain-containing phosphohydrolase [Gaiella sp.]|uniref:HD-GYP domain-containing protein n=1 Tax=Gaiella sp. TaxID=2663207 RepID=UPI0032664E15
MRLSEIIASLSYALDIADGNALGHSIRSCLIGMRLADEIGLEVEGRSSLFYGLLLKDAGCSSNAARVTALYRGDDLELKRRVKLVNHNRVPEALRYIWDNVGATSFRDRTSLAFRAARLGPRTARENTEIRCERGAEIALMLDLPLEVANAIRSLDEHWDGSGQPRGLRGEAIPLLGRILGLAQVVEVFNSAHGLTAAVDMAHGRDRRWFDPTLVKALDRIRDDAAFWRSLLTTDLATYVAYLEPPDLSLAADDSRLDRVAEAFALVIDAKSPYTFRHSERVAEIAVVVAEELGHEPTALRNLRRAGLLHDIGKLGISNLILDKEGPLEPAERATVNRHPALTEEILARVPAFKDIAGVAASHHEKLDGSGYHRGLKAADLSPAARILVVADIYEALTAERPYRSSLEPSEALALLRGEAGTKVCGNAFTALEAVVNQISSPRLPAEKNAA